jgi:hypothetical protein
MYLSHLASRSEIFGFPPARTSRRLGPPSAGVTLQGLVVLRPAPNEHVSVCRGLFVRPHDSGLLTTIQFCSRHATMPRVGNTEVRLSFSNSHKNAVWYWCSHTKDTLPRPCVAWRSPQLVESSRCHGAGPRTSRQSGAVSALGRTPGRRSVSKPGSTRHTQ